MNPTKPAFRPTFARVDLDAVVHNFNLIKSFAGSAEVCAVVKADAYGHGMEEVAKALEAGGCSHFAVSSLDEGVQLRGLGVGGHVLLLFGVAPQNASVAAKAGLVPMINSLGMLEGIAREVSRGGFTFPIHLNFDTGMGRDGIPPDELDRAVEILQRCPGLVHEGTATHFACAGDSEEFTSLQVKIFEALLGEMLKLGIQPGIVHAANSAGVMSRPDTAYDMVRAGIALYGGVPEPGLPRVDELRPAMEWTSRIVLIRDVEVGTPLSYGGTFTTGRASRIATIPIGYADGLSRRLGNRGRVLIGEYPAPIVGRVCMDVTLVDVTDLPDVKEGDEVVFIGRRGVHHLDAEQMARMLETINYEILCCVGKRVPRKYVGG